MTFTTFKLTELPLRTTLPLFSSSFTKPSFHHSLKIMAFSTSSSLRTNKTHTSKTRPQSKSAWTSRRSPATNSHSKPLQSDAGDPPRHFAGDRAQNAIERIVLRLRNLGLASDDEQDAGDDVDGGGDFTPMATGDESLADLLRREWIRPDTLLYGDRDGDRDDVSLPWEKEEAEGRVEEGGGGGGRRRAKAPTLAELTMEDEELRRLRRMGMYLRERISIPKAGLTKEVLQKIHDKWKKEELVRLKFHEVLARDMKTAHEIVERRTGGLVIWKAGSVMVVFRGPNYQGPPTSSSKPDSLFVPDVSSSTDTGDAMELSPEKIEPAVRKIERISKSLTEEEMEYNSLLDGLGPRFEEWWGTGVLPVDADLLPPNVPCYKTPFRLLPTGMRSRLTNAEMTNMRKLAKSLPCHFALGRNRNHQGLAVAILKLWEKSSVVKIAVKRGIQNTNNKLMAEELKALTGGVLLLRNKYYIVMYRGKDFLPTSVAAVLAERQELTKKIQDVEEKVRSGGVETAMQHEDEGKPLSGTLAEFYEAQARWGKDISAEEHEKMIEEAFKAKHAKLVKRVEHKLAIAQAKKLRAERLLSKIEASMIPAGPDYDQETITDEERIMFRRVGLRMKAYLPLGIRGVFDGVIENMHLHWKHRELVKLISKQKTLAFVEDTARLLEYESGGILVAIERVPKGFAVIYYRGKNYRRPINIRPRNLLTKAKALKRSVAMQRHEALSEHISELERTTEQMKKEIGLPPEGNESDWSSGEDEDSNHVSAFAQSEDEVSWLESIGEEEEEEDDDDDGENGYKNNDDDNYDEDSDWDSDEDFQISSSENNDRRLTKSG